MGMGCRSIPTMPCLKLSRPCTGKGPNSSAAYTRLGLGLGLGVRANPNPSPNPKPKPNPHQVPSGAFGGAEDWALSKTGAVAVF